ncbi:hypothetical protein Plhal304r1_c065g0153141 [Plasmopara halstedii]
MNASYVMTILFGEQCSFCRPLLQPVSQNCVVLVFSKYKYFGASQQRERRPSLYIHKFKSIFCKSVKDPILARSNSTSFETTSVDCCFNVVPASLSLLSELLTKQQRAT